MSYRNDHDAALARIDALEAELGKNSDARERFTTLEKQLATAKAERDRAREALGKKAGRSLLAPVGFAVAALLCVGGVALLKSMSYASAPIAPIDPPPVAKVAEVVHTDARTAELMACVRDLDRAVANHVTSSPSCIASIKHQASDLTLGDDIHAILGDWYAAESKLSLDGNAVASRDALVDRIHAYVIPSYTR